MSAQFLYRGKESYGIFRENMLGWKKQKSEAVQMRDLKSTCRVALVQAEPVLFDKAKGLEKTLRLIREASEKFPELIVFPELFIPGYPFGMNFGFGTGTREAPGRVDWLRYYDASIVVPGPETEALGAAAKAAGAYLSIGVSERVAESGTLYNTNLIFSPDGALVSHHRKLKPTGSERLIWGDAQSHYFPVVDTPWGAMGSLICWESYMPLARVALYEKGVTLYLSPNTNDNAEWHNTISHIAIEGKCFFINSDMLITKASYPRDLATYDRDVARLPDVICRGGSCIMDPFGHYLTEPVWDEEAIIVAELDMAQASAARMEFDPCGHYSRPDVLELRVHEETVK